MISFLLSPTDIVLGLTLEGGDERTGYLLVTYIGDQGTSSMGTVCGAVDADTAQTACLSAGWFRVVASGTVGELGISSPGSNHGIKLSNLRCTELTSQNSRVSYTCTYETLGNSSCSPSQAAAISCSLNGGEIAGIVIVCLAVFVVIVTIPIVVICFCVFRTPKGKRGQTKPGDPTATIRKDGDYAVPSNEHSKLVNEDSDHNDEDDVKEKEENPKEHTDQEAEEEENPKTEI
jgi:hypothetical protein